MLLGGKRADNNQYSNEVYSAAGPPLVLSVTLPAALYTPRWSWTSGGLVVWSDASGVRGYSLRTGAFSLLSTDPGISGLLWPYGPDVIGQNSNNYYGGPLYRLNVSSGALVPLPS